MSSNDKGNYPPKKPLVPKPDTIPYTPPSEPVRKDGSKIVLGIVLGVFITLIIAAAVIGALILTNVIPLDEKQDTNSAKSTQATTTNQSNLTSESEKETEITDEASAETISEDASETTPKSGASMYIANVPYSVYFRSSPSESDNNIKTTIPLATQVTVYENQSNGFSLVSYNGSEGYVKSAYLSHTKPAENKTISKYMYVANVPYSVYLRNTPSENSSNICTIPLGTLVGFIEKTDSTFSKVNYNGSIGYVKSQYLSDSPSYSSDYSNYMTVYNVPYSIYLRSTPREDSSNIICEIPVGSTVEYLNSGNGTFYYISWNGRTGYSKAEYLR